jgi:hypothetical protein
MAHAPAHLRDGPRHAESSAVRDPAAHVTTTHTHHLDRHHRPRRGPLCRWPSRSAHQRPPGSRWRPSLWRSPWLAAVVRDPAIRDGRGRVIRRDIRTVATRVLRVVSNGAVAVREAGCEAFVRRCPSEWIATLGCVGAARRWSPVAAPATAGSSSLPLRSQRCALVAQPELVANRSGSKAARRQPHPSSLRLDLGHVRDMVGGVTPLATAAILCRIVIAGDLNDQLVSSRVSQRAAQKAAYNGNHSRCPPTPAAEPRQPPVSVTSGIVRASATSRRTSPSIMMPLPWRQRTAMPRWRAEKAASSRV